MIDHPFLRLDYSSKAENAKRKPVMDDICKMNDSFETQVADVDRPLVAEIIVPSIFGQNKPTTAASFYAKGRVLKNQAKAQ